MEFRRVRAGIKRVLSRKAFTLIETMVAFVIIGITALFTAAGLIAGLGIYQKANDLRDTCENAVTMLYEAAEYQEEVDEYDPENIQVGVVTRTGEFAVDSSLSSYIDVYEICALRNNPTLKTKGIVFYYYAAPKQD